MDKNILAKTHIFNPNFIITLTVAFVAIAISFNQLLLLLLMLLVLFILFYFISYFLTYFSHTSN
jgi:hypothetical protein